MELDIELHQLLEDKASKYSPNDLKRTAKEMTDKYTNESGKGNALITSDIEVATYGVIRMPATYSSVSKALLYTSEITNDKYDSILDVGAGLGAASWATLPYINELTSITCLEREPMMLKNGKELMEAHPILNKANWEQVDFVNYKKDITYDLVIASYSLNELDSMTRLKVALNLWEMTGKTLLIVEPGTPTCYQELCAIKEYLVSKGAYVIAPCPHNGPCPLSTPDWCHFSSRIARTRLHKLIKDGDVPYEDEKFFYLALGRKEYKEDVQRLLRHPDIYNGFIDVKICNKDGINTSRITKKNKELYKEARKANVGDNLFNKGKGE